MNVHLLLKTSLLIVAAAASGGCQAPGWVNALWAPGTQGEAHDGHDHGGGGGGGGGHHDREPEPVSLTNFTDRTELFVEFPPLVRGRRSRFAAHLTWLDGYRPVTAGRMEVKLTGGGGREEIFAVDAPGVPGIFRPVATPEHTGERRLSLSLTVDGQVVTHDLGTVTVHPDLAAVPTGGAEPRPELITFLKEQQWKVDFGTEEVAQRSLRVALSATGVLGIPADAQLRIVSPTSGRLLPGIRLPVAGARLGAGQVVAAILPRVSVDVDLDSLELEARRSRAALELAQRERERLEGLVERRAAPERSLAEARAREQVARAEVAASASRLKRYRSGLGNEGGAAAEVRVQADQGGRVTSVHVVPGQSVQAGDTLIDLVDEERLWLRVNVSELDLHRLAAAPAGATFRIPGLDDPLEASPANGDRLLAFAPVIDPVTRTAPVTFELARPDARLHPGMDAAVQLWTGEARTVTAIPATAIVLEAGLPVAYVMADGEHFERRVLRTGIRSAAFVEVLAGLAPGERVVNRGAYLVRLAGTSPAAAGHGH